MMMHRVTQMLETGQVDSVLEELQSGLEPDFLIAHPELLFELHR